MIYGLLGLGIALLLFLLVQLYARSAGKPDHLGPHQNHPQPCPPTPNCVCSYSEGSESPASNIHPLPWGDPDRDLDQTRDALLIALSKISGCRPVTISRNYVHAQWTSRLFGYVDDLEFFFDDQKPVIHLRSASRRGRSDLGFNRQRIECLRQLLEN